MPVKKRTKLAAGAAMLAGFVMATEIAAAQSPVRIVVTFTEVRIGPSGNDSVIVTLEGTLLGGNRITDRDRRQREGGGGGLRGGGRSQTNEGTFGSGVRPFEGRGATATWHVGANDTLVRTLVRSSDIETTTITLTGSSACRATVTFRLKPGRNSFVRDGGKDRFLKVHAENISCSISG